MKPESALALKMLNSKSLQDQEEDKDKEIATNNHDNQ